MAQIISSIKEIGLVDEAVLLLKIRMKKLALKRKKIGIKQKKILVVDTCIVGDFMATLPALSLFLEKNDLTADIIVSPVVKTLCENINRIDRVFVAKTNYVRDIEKKKLRELQQKNGGSDSSEKLDAFYSTMLIMKLSPDAYKMIRNIKCENIMTYDVAVLKFLLRLVGNIFFWKKPLQSREVNYITVGLHQKDKDIKFEKIFHFKKTDYETAWKLLELKENSEKVKIIRINDEEVNDKKTIIIHTGSGWRLKMWENKKWVKLIKKINAAGNFRFVFVGGTESERKSFQYIEKRLPFKVYSVIKKADIKNVLLLMRQSDYFIGIDSGPRNLAHIANLRSVTLLGAGVKSFSPLSKKDIIVTKGNPNAINLIKFRKPGMKSISVNDVFSAFLKLTKSGV